MAQREKGTSSILIRNIVNLWIDQIKSPLFVIGKNCYRFSHELIHHKQISPIKIQYSAFSIERIDEIKIEQLIKAFIRNIEGDPESNTKDLFTIIRSFDYFKAITKKIEETYNSFRDETFELQDHWNSGLTLINQLEMEMHAAKADMSDPSTKEFIMKFNSIRQNWHSLAGNVEAENTKTVLLDPTMDLVREQLNKNPSNIYARSLGQIIFDLTITYKKWKKIQEAYSSIFKTFALNMLDSYKELKIVNVKIPNKFNKNLCSLE